MRISDWSSDVCSSDLALFLYPDGFVSADVASLAGRLSAAASRGEQGRLELSPSLLARRDQFAILERERPRAMKEFFANIQVRFGGRDVYLFGFWPLLSDWAVEGLAQGVRGRLGPTSVLVTGGGTRGGQWTEGGGGGTE